MKRRRRRSEGQTRVLQVPKKKDENPIQSSLGSISNPVVVQQQQQQQQQ